MQPALVLAVQPTRIDTRMELEFVTEQSNAFAKHTTTLMLHTLLRMQCHA